MPLQLQSRITVQSKDFGTATRGKVALQALVVELANDARVMTVFDKMRADREHCRRIARFHRLMKAGQTYPNAWHESHLQEPNPALGSALDKALVELFGRHVPHVCGPLLLAFLGMEWIRLTGCEARLDIALHGMPTIIPPPDYSTMPTRERKKAMQQHTDTLMAQVPPRGRAPRSPKVTIRNVKWYVQHVLQSVSIGKLARAYHRTEHPNQDPDDYVRHRRLIQQSLPHIAALLDLPARISK